MTPPEDSSVEISKVAYAMTIGDTKFGNVRPGVVEATLKPGKTLEDALDELDDRLNAWHRKRYAHLYQESGLLPLSYPIQGVQPGTATIDYKAKEQLEILIDNAETVADLAVFKEQCWLMGLSKEWINKNNELNGRPTDFAAGLE